MVATSKEAYNKSDAKFSSSRSKIYSNEDIERMYELIDSGCNKN